jgi:alkanesulfonate monooxygenase SsuD/methylene tetrahydromethanopterin reductase-like flavin-dependent oxidoreductase (luciferase family)
MTLKLVARYADACNITNPDIALLERKLSILKHRCEELGRDYQGIKRTVLLNCAIAETDEKALAKLGSIERALVGTPETIRQRLRVYEQAGIQEIMLYMPDAATVEPLRLFARECMGA